VLNVFPASSQSEEKKNGMNKRNSIAWIGTLTLLLTGFLGALATVKAAGVPDSEQVAKLLSEAKTQAFQLKEDAATMESYARMNVSWESHAAAINQIKDHVNALGRQAAKLKDARSTASPWQKTAIDRIDPFLEELTNYTYAIIEHLNGEEKHTLAEYQGTSWTTERPGKGWRASGQDSRSQRKSKHEEAIARLDRTQPKEHEELIDRTPSGGGFLECL
jgi:hypothetical protein